MAIKPKIQTLTNSSVDILNVIRNNATTNYKHYVPVATADADSIKEIGAVIMDSPQLQNEFLTALVNRIGRVIVTSKMYSNPWNIFKQGILELGETQEEIFVNIAKPFQYDPAVAESELFKREIPDVRSAFHVMNYTKFYKTTVSQQQLKQAFLSWAGVTDLITKITESLYTAANYDEFQVMKYMLAKQIINGRLSPVSIPVVSSSNMETIVSEVKSESNMFEFLSPDYNYTGVMNNSMKSEQTIIVNSNFDAYMDVEVLAAAFNMNKAEFLGRKVLVDSFGKLDTERLAILFDGDSTYTEFSDDELKALDAIPVVMVDEKYFMIYDNLLEFTEEYNGQGLYWNYFLHTWKTFSVSPFANNAMFIPGTPSVTAVNVSPSTATVKAGQSISLTANVETEFFAPQTVDWTSDTENVTVSKGGVVTVASSVAGGTSVTITATSTYDSSVTGTATITVEA